MPRFSSVAEVFEAMPKYFVPEAAAGMNAVIQLELTGEGGGLWHITVADQQVKVAEGQAANPKMTLKMASADYLAMINGDANAMQMFMQGKVKVGGDMSLAMKMQSIFNMQ
jgi:putative sterol carrier protein